MDINNIDDFIAQVQADELADATKLSPREYGKLRGITPQLVYYHIKVGHVAEEFCQCGRKVIDIQQADEYFKRGDFDPAKIGSLAGDDE
jgi:hypothetical protein